MSETIMFGALGGSTAAMLWVLLLGALVARKGVMYR